MEEEDKTMRQSKPWVVSVRWNMMMSLLCIAVVCGACAARGQTLEAPAWITAWSTFQQGLAESTISNATIRLL